MYTKNTCHLWIFWTTQFISNIKNTRSKLDCHLWILCFTPYLNHFIFVYFVSYLNHFIFVYFVSIIITLVYDIRSTLVYVTVRIRHMIYQGNEKMDYIVIRSINSICIYFSYTKLYEICIRQVDYQGNEKMDYKRIRTAYTVTNVLLCSFWFGPDAGDAGFCVLDAQVVRRWRCLRLYVVCCVWCV